MGSIERVRSVFRVRGSALRSKLFHRMRKHEIIADSQKQTDCGRWRGQASRGRRYHSQFYQSPHRLGSPSLSFFRFDAGRNPLRFLSPLEANSVHAFHARIYVGLRGFVPPPGMDQSRRSISRRESCEREKNFFPLYIENVYLSSLSTFTSLLKNSSQTRKNCNQFDPVFSNLKEKKNSNFDTRREEKRKKKKKKIDFSPPCGLSDPAFILSSRGSSRVHFALCASPPRVCAGVSSSPPPWQKRERERRGGRILSG